MYCFACSIISSVAFSYPYMHNIYNSAKIRIYFVHTLAHMWFRRIYILSRLDLVIAGFFLSCSLYTNKMLYGRGTAAIHLIMYLWLDSGDSSPQRLGMVHIILT